MTLNERRIRLEAFLLETAPLWRASTFRERRPAWCAGHPELTAALLALDEKTLAALSGDLSATLAWLTPTLPVLQALPGLTDLPSAEVAARPARRPKTRNRGIPGRKVGQIDAFVAAVGQPQAPLVEWCAGKGHLSRRFLETWGGAALAVERDATLCASGSAIAERLRQAQRFLTADVLQVTTAGSLNGAHAIALHACGDLHRRFIETAARLRVPAVDVAPCCYQLTADEWYRPLCPDATLSLDRLALKLAVTETVTASPREAADSARASAWKLAFLILREELRPGVEYETLRPVPAAWISHDFPAFLTQLAQRESLPLPSGLDHAACEATGWQRHHESRRLQLVRMAFRRALEVWLLCDLAVWLEGEGYVVTLKEFCRASLTPRNVLLSARIR
ncbi:MAG: methyltransferase [Verrucomicrobiaceae bacterium]|nr:methyltransferase [Verrucomicrobiaceae bacterium]